MAKGKKTKGSDPKTSPFSRWIKSWQGIVTIIVGIITILGFFGWKPNFLGDGDSPSPRPFLDMCSIDGISLVRVTALDSGRSRLNFRLSICNSNAIAYRVKVRYYVLQRFDESRLEAMIPNMPLADDGLVIDSSMMKLNSRVNLAFALSPNPFQTSIKTLFIASEGSYSDVYGNSYNAEIIRKIDLEQMRSVSMLQSELDAVAHWTKQFKPIFVE